MREGRGTWNGVASLEHEGMSHDLRLLLDAVRRFQDGAGTIGLVAPHLPQAKLRSYQGVVAKTENWRTLGAEAEEIAYLEGMEEDETDREMASAAD